MGANDLNRVYFGGTSAGGNSPTSTTSDWVSYTFKRPSSRLAPNGQRLFIVKNLRFQVAGKGAKRKIYGRVSYADGDPSANSSSTTVASQSSARTNLDCKNLNFPMSDAVGGPNMRVWIVTGSTFYFDRNTGGTGHMVAKGGKTFSGSPVGYLEFAEVPSAPQNVKGTRAIDDPTRVTFSWDQESDAGGGSLLGYVIETATDPDFSVDVQSYEVNGRSFTRSGYDPDTLYYIRVAAENEVSKHFNTTGLWSPRGTLQKYIPPAPPPDDEGSAPIKITYMRDDPTPGDPVNLVPFQSNVMQQAVRLEATGQWYVAQNDAAKTGDQTVTISRLTPGGTQLDKMTLTLAGHGTAFQLEKIGSDVYIWLCWANAGKRGATNDLIRFKYRTGTYNRDNVGGVTMPKYGSGYVNIAFDRINNWVCIRRKPAATTDTYELRKLNEYLGGVDKTYGKITLPQGETNNTVTSMQGFATYLGSLWRWTGTANSATDLPILREYSWSTGLEVAEFDGSDLGRLGNGSFPNNFNEPEGISLYNTDNTDAKLYVGVTLGTGSGRTWKVWPIDLLTQAAALQSAGYHESTDPGGPDGTDDGTPTPEVPTDNGNTGGSQGTSGGTDVGTTPTGVTVYAPIPDTSSTRTAMGGLLISRAPRLTPGHTVFLMDRGGKRRLDVFMEPTSVEYNRIRDDMSEATLKFSGKAVAANADAFDKIAAGRHEICIYRGVERVWEGPISRPTWKGSGVEIKALDVLHYANRTIMRGAYSNAHPNEEYAVSRIAGIMSAEMARKEAISPAINVLPYLRTYIEEGDARTTRVTDGWTQYVFQHLDDMAAKSGIDYTVIGRAIHIWDTSRAALGRLRTVTELDFLGDTYISAYGMETATVTGVSDGQGGFGTAGGVDPFYGEIELLSTAYDENGDQIDPDDPTSGTVSQAELDSQAQRNLAGRNPTPYGLHVPDGSQFALNRGLGLDVLIPGVYVPVKATLSGKTLSQMMKLKEVRVIQDADGERATISLTPASATAIDEDTTDE